MKLLKQINLMDDQKTIKRLNLAVIPSFIFFYVFFTLFVLGGHGSNAETSFIFDLLILMVAYFILIIIHELIHGAFFKLFDPKGKVKFGFKNGVAYATSPHSLAFLWVSFYFIWLVDGISFYLDCCRTCRFLCGRLLLSFSDC